jgi:hypothetical protein
LFLDYNYAFTTVQQIEAKIVVVIFVVVAAAAAVVVTRGCAIVIVYWILRCVCVYLDLCMCYPYELPAGTKNVPVSMRNPHAWADCNRHLVDLL